MCRAYFKKSTFPYCGDVNESWCHSPQNAKKTGSRLLLLLMSSPKVIRALDLFHAIRYESMI